MRHLPNILSGLRLVLVGVFVMLFRAGRYLPALCVFVFAFFTDVLDGQIARANGWVSNVGKLLDPLADKLMTLAALVCIYLGKMKSIYLVLFLLMALKELLMIIGGLFMGLSRQAATEFSFFLAIPTLLISTVYSLYKERALLSFDDVGMWVVGFVAAFVSAFFCVRWLLRYVATHDFVPFAWYRIGFGVIVMATWYFDLVSWTVR